MIKRMNMMGLNMIGQALREAAENLCAAVDWAEDSEKIKGRINEILKEVNDLTATADMYANTAILKSWSLQRERRNNLNVHVYGTVYGSRKFEDGTFICTSAIKNIERIEEGCLVETQNSVYLLVKDLD